MAKQAKRASTREVLADLIDRPPLNEGELGRRLRDVDRPDVRREIVDRIFDGSAPRDALEMLAAALLKLGVDGQEARLERIASDVRRGRAERWTALSLIFSASPERANRVLVELHPDDGLRLMLQPAAQAITDVVAETAAGEAIADALGALPEEVLPDAVAYLEEVRKRAGTPAILAYRGLLQRDRLVGSGARPPTPRRSGPPSLLDLLLEAIVDEGGAQAGAELIRLRDEAADPATRHAFQRALLRLGTRDIEVLPGPPSVKGKAHLGICDGQGAFILLGCFENADGSTSIADLCIHAAAEVRDGFAAAMDERDVASLFGKMRESGLGDLAPLSLAEGAAMAFAAVERSRRRGVPLPEEARPAILLFERARGAAGVPPVPSPAGRGPVTPAEARALLALPYYESWFFDAGDLAGAGVPAPDLGRAGKAVQADESSRPGKPRARRRKSTAGAEWATAALAKLEASEVAPRLEAMLEHMARWHGLRGEVERAAVCAAALDEARRSFRAGALPRALLDRSIEVLRAQGGERTGVVGDPDSRDRIRVQLFHEVNDPKGKDLAALDLTEAALVALTGALESLPGSRRPREDDLLQAAFALGTLFARWVVARRQTRPEALLAEMTKALGVAKTLDPGERADLVSVVLPALAAFVGEVCERCPISCLTRPKADVADAFFAVEHPAFA